MHDTTPTHTPPTLVLDLDGTLADTAPDLLGTLNTILARQGLAPLSLGQVRGMLGAGAKALLQRGLVASGRAMSDGELEGMFEAFLSHYSAHIADFSRLYPGVEAALDRFAETGWRLAICTNKLEGLSRTLIEALGVSQRFAAICGRDSFAWCKPDPRHLTLTVEKVGGQPHRAVMVGDSVTDIATAKAARIPVVAVSFGYTDVPVAQLQPDRVIDHFDDLFAAANALLGHAGART
jgi:phosphoglycolate phosphatase